jgi:hypothetical protein
MDLRISRLPAIWRREPLARKLLLATATSMAAVVLIVGTTSGAVPSHGKLGGTARTRHRHVGSSNRIVVGEGMAGVALGERRQQLAAVLGRPTAIVPPYWDYARGLDGRAALEQNRVTDLWTRSPTQKTASGVGPGVSMRRLRRAYRAIRCNKAGHGSDAICVLRSHHRGMVVETDFMVERGRVRQVEIFSVALPTKGTPIVVHK